MITHAKTRLSLALLVSIIGSGSANGMQGPMKTRFFVDSEKKIERFLDLGDALLHDSSLVVGQKMVLATPFKFMGEEEKQKISDALNKAANSNDKVKCVCKLWTALLHTSILPMKDAQNNITFLVKITKEISSEVNPPCEVKTVKGDARSKALSDREYLDSLSDQEYQEVMRERTRRSGNVMDRMWAETDYYIRKK